MPGSRFEVPSPIAHQLVSTMRGEIAGERGIVARARRELTAASARARRTGAVSMPRLGLRLPVYRVSLFDRPYDLVTRDGDAGAERIVGIVPADAVPPRRVSDQDPIVSEEEATLLALEMLGLETEEELDLFLGKVFKSVAKAAKGVVKTVGNVGKAVGKVVDTVSKVVPVKAIINLTPIGLAARAAKSVGRIASGENVFKVAGNFVKSGLKDVGQAVKLASTVASFIPGVGTGVAAALGAAGALAEGKPITEAILAAAKSALPGGAIAGAAFDVASGLARGKSLSEAALSAARNQLPGGQAARAAFDAGLALARGKKIQDAAAAAAGSLAPPQAQHALRLAERFTKEATLPAFG